MITVRPAIPADIPFVLRCILELADFEKLRHEVEATEDGLRGILFGPGPVAEAAVAECEGEPVGYALFFPFFSSFKANAGIHLEDVYVRPHLRGRGVGRALLGWVARAAVQRGCARMQWQVLDWNENALRLYRGLGGQPLDGWLTYRLEGAALQRLAAQGG